MRDTGLWRWVWSTPTRPAIPRTGVNIGIVDSGFFAGHVREHAVTPTKLRCRGARYHSATAHGGYTGPTPGYFYSAFNDDHGTHVSGTVDASRDGVGDGTENNMQGVAFDAGIHLGNTHKTGTARSTARRRSGHDAGGDAGQRATSKTSTRP